MAEVTIRDLRKAYGAMEVLHGVNVDIADGQFVVLVGPSGCGKSTLLRMIAGLESVTGGRITIGDKIVNNLPPSERDIAMVFQNYALYPHKTVAANMGFALKMAKMPKAEIDARVARAAEILGLQPYLTRVPRDLSGGQRQRVAMGRAIVRNPSVFLFDEPLSNLDAKLRVQMRTEIRELHQRLATTTVYVTHDQIEAMTMATHVGVLDAGHLVQFGTPREIYENPANLYVAGRLGLPRINALPAGLFPGAPPGAATIGLRPEHIAQGDGQPARVVRVEHLGDQTRLHLSLEGHEVTTLTDPHSALTAGDTVAIHPRAALYFDASGARLA